MRAARPAYLPDKSSCGQLVVAVGPSYRKLAPQRSEQPFVLPDVARLHHKHPQEYIVDFCGGEECFRALFLLFRKSCSSLRRLTLSFVGQNGFN